MRCFTKFSSLSTAFSSGATYLSVGDVMLKVAVISVVVFSIMLNYGYSTQARAEAVLNFVQMTCVPEFEYFSLRTLTVSRNAHKIITADVLAATSKRLESEEQMFSPESLIKQPYQCSSSTRHIIVKIDGYITPHEKGGCALCKNFDIAILVNGEEVDRFSAYGVSALETHWAELDHTNLLRDCTFENYEDHKSCWSKRIALCSPPCHPVTSRDKL